MTYAAPRKWYHAIFAPFAVCQHKDIDTQIGYGIGCFDLRVRLHKGKWIFAHGWYEVKGNIYEVIGKIESAAKKFNCPVYVRLILEASKYNKEQEERFVQLCEALQQIKEITYIGGNRKYDWKQLYDFGNDIELWQPVSSMAKDARWYEKIMPLLYAMRKNNDNLGKALFHKITLMDFV